MEFTNSDYIAIYAAVISTVVLLMQIAEKIKSYYRIEVSLNTDNARYESNKINIKNLSGKPIMVEHLELEWRKWFWPFKKIEKILIEDNNFFENIIVQSHCNKLLKFEEENYFNTNKKPKEGYNLYIKLHISGKYSPKCIRVE
ncbi:hypothetical protein [Aeromonas media]|uniref:hypothetical protein n=1 Tax=Aeromonas media TaxID=651 RepID=UPI000FBEA4DE|nr:hypothetical protein [Aeromonas media]